MPARVDSRRMEPGRQGNIPDDSVYRNETILLLLSIRIAWTKPETRIASRRPGPVEEIDEIAAPHHSITSSAVRRRASVLVSPIAFAVLRLMASSNRLEIPLRPRRERPSRRAAEKRDELAPSHTIAQRFRTRRIAYRPGSCMRKDHTPRSRPAAASDHSLQMGGRRKSIHVRCSSKATRSQSLGGCREGSRGGRREPLQRPPTVARCRRSIGWAALAFERGFPATALDIHL